VFIRSRGRSAAAFLITAAACWGGAAVIAKRAVDEIEPLVLLPIELSVSAVVLALVTWVRRQHVVRSPEMRRLTLLGVLNPGLAYALSLAGLARLSASVSVLLWAVEPVMILLIAWVVLRERESTYVAVCAAIALAGVLMVVVQPGGAASTFGVVLTLAGVGACATYTVMSRSLIREASTVPVVLMQQLAALLFAVVLLTVSLPVSGVPSLSGISATAWWSAIVAGALYYGVAFCFYLAGLRNVSAGQAGLFINLVPVFGITAGAVVLDEQLSSRQWIGAMIVIVAVAAVAVGSGSSSPPSPASASSTERGAQRVEA
jgi:drug/metabolite transporter (DMT)-like permease